MSYSQNLSKINETIRVAENKVGRISGSVSLVAVSKAVDAAAITRMHEAGQRIFAENRAQSLRDKTRLLEQLPLEWHFVGPLQSNKIKYVYPVASLVHSIDRVALIEQFISWYEKSGKKCPILLQVHISGEEAKQGFACDEVLEVIRKYQNHPALDIRGLMGMAAYVDDEEVVRASFKKLAQLLEKSRELEGTAYKAKELSMGMSGDFQIAIEEGATLVRIGTILFGE